MLNLTIDEAREVVNIYYMVPGVPDGELGFAEFRVPVAGDRVLSADIRVYTVSPSSAAHGKKRLILTPKPKKYRFICDSLEPRAPKVGDWVFRSVVVHVTTLGRVDLPQQVEFDWDDTPKNRVIIFRREEV